MKVYIAGKITGDRRYRAKFREAAKALEEAGHVVLNPATLPDGLDDVDYMRICMAMVDAADLAVFLPDYRESRGAMVEWASWRRTWPSSTEGPIPGAGPKCPIRSTPSRPWITMP